MLEGENSAGADSRLVKILEMYEGMAEMRSDDIPRERYLRVLQGHFNQAYTLWLGDEELQRRFPAVAKGREKYLEGNNPPSAIRKKWGA